jgi:hypothetical protein
VKPFSRRSVSAYLQDLLINSRYSSTSIITHWVIPPAMCDAGRMHLPLLQPVGRRNLILRSLKLGVTLGGPAEPGGSAAGGAFPGNSAIFDNMCPPRTRPNCHSDTAAAGGAIFGDLYGAPPYKYLYGPWHSEMSE